MFYAAQSPVSIWIDAEKVDLRVNRALLRVDLSYPEGASLEKVRLRQHSLRRAPEKWFRPEYDNAKEGRSQQEAGIPR